jgi:hypothetical protein
MKQNQLYIGFLLPRIDEIIFISFFLGAISLGPRMLNIDGDLGRHLAIGRYILGERQIPTSDVFSHTMYGEYLTPHEWLAQVCFALANSWGGLNGVVLLCAILLGITYTICFKQCYQQSQVYSISLVFTVIGASAASLHWLARPHLFTLLMVALWMEGINQVFEKNGRWMWLCPILMLFWANLHGAFIVGFVILVLCIIARCLDILFIERKVGKSFVYHLWNDQTIRGYVIIGIASFIATLLNPSGWYLWRTVFDFLQNRYLVSHTAEYLPPNFHHPSTIPFLIFIALSLLIFGLKKQRASTKDVLLLTALTAMGLYSVRNIPIYALIVAPILSGLIGIGGEISHSHDVDKSYTSKFFWESLKEKIYNFELRLKYVNSLIKGYTIPIAVVSIVLLLFSNGINLDLKGRGNQFDPHVFPVEAVNWIVANLPMGNMFNYFPWGGYLLYRLHPMQRVFIDGQTDFYGESLTREYETVITLSNGWEEILDKYRIEWVIFPSDSILVKELLGQPKWKLVYQDQVTSVFFLDR